jgi:hypothetical protein
VKYFGCHLFLKLRSPNKKYVNRRWLYEHWLCGHWLYGCCENAKLSHLGNGNKINFAVFDVRHLVTSPQYMLALKRQESITAVGGLKVACLAADWGTRQLQNGGSLDYMASSNAPLVCMQKLLYSNGLQIEQGTGVS